MRPESKTFVRMAPDGRKNEQGMVMVVVLLLVAILVVLGTTGIITVTTDMKISSNYRESQKALYDAEAGAQQVIATLRTTPNYPTSAASPTTVNLTVPSGFNFSSSVQLTYVANNLYRFQITGNAANNASKTLEVHITRSPLYPATADGAVAMYGGGPQVDFKTGGGGGYNVDGNDYALPANPNCNGNACRTASSPATAVPGLYTPSLTPTVNGDAGSHLGGSTGSTPRVGGGSNTEADWQAFVNTILADPSLYQSTLGTRANPAVTVVPGGSTLNGSSNGAGIIIVQDSGEFHMAGNSCFEGLVILLGNGTLTATGTAIVYGSTVTINHTSKLVDVNGTTDLYYSSEALANLQNISSLNPVKMASWRDVQ
jgi:hypothetical protein